MTDDIFLLQDIASEGGDQIKQEKFNYACSVIVTDIITPLYNSIVNTVGFRDFKGIMSVHDCILECAKIHTNKLYALLNDEQNIIDSVSFKKTLQAALQAEADIIENKNNDKAMLWFLRVLELLQYILEDAKNHNKFINIRGKLINTPYKLGKFISSSLLCQENLLSDKTDIFARLEYIIKTAQNYDPSIVTKGDPESDGISCAL